MKSPAVRLESWSVRETGDRYTAPEHRVPLLVGNAYGHPKFADGDCVETSEIVSTKGRKVTTRSGRVYVLGEPDPGYVEWLAGQGRKLNQRRPVIMRAEK